MERKTPTAQSCQQTMQQLANEKQHSQFPVHIHIVAQHYIVTQLEYKLFQTGGTELTKCFQNFAVLNMQCFSFFLQKLILHLNLLFIHVLKRKSVQCDAQILKCVDIGSKIKLMLRRLFSRYNEYTHTHMLMRMLVLSLMQVCYYCRH